MRIIRIPGAVQKVFNAYTWRIGTSADEVYLTFDDGPSPQITKQVLTWLKAYGAYGNFFCIGRNVERHPDIYHQILSEGHRTGNHTYSHLNGINTRNEEYMNDIKLASQLILSNLFRPPYGMITPRQGRNLHKEGYRIIMWDILSYDFAEKMSEEKCLTGTLKNLRKGSVIVFHDSEKAKKNLYYALPRLLEYLSAHQIKTKLIE